MITRRLALLLTVLASPLQAQQDSTVVPLPAITVNALRSVLPLQRTPLAVTVLDVSRTLARGRGTALAETLRELPGLQIDDRHNPALGERISIRGFGARSAFGVRGIRVLVDGIPATMPDGQTNLNHVDAAQVLSAELVRGPAAAFLGNAAGGALQLRTGSGGAPAIDGSAGSSGLLRFAARTNLPAGSSYASWVEERGYRDYDRSRRGVAGVVLGSGVGQGRVEGAMHAAHWDALRPGALTAAEQAADPTQADPRSARQHTSERGTHLQLGGGWLTPLGRALQLEVRPYLGWRTLYNPIPPRIIELDRLFGGGRAQLAGVTPRFTWAGGVELEAQQDQRLNYTNEAGERGALVLDQRERVRGAALFAQGGYAPSPQLRLFGAARRDGYRFSVADRLVSGTNPDDSGARSLAATSFSTGVTAELRRGLELYGNVGSAFETPTTTELANRPDGAGGFNPELQPERTLGVEGGVRWNGRLLAGEIAVFSATVKDKLVQFEVESFPGRQFFRNAGRARHQGIEGTAAITPLPALTLRLAGTWLDASFLEYVAGGVDYAGNAIPGVAARSLEAGADVRAGDAVLQLHARHLGRVPVNDANTAWAAAYAVLDVRVQHERLVQFGGWSTTAYGGIDNLLDRAYTSAVVVNAAAARYYEPAPGRSLYLGVTLSRR